MSNEQWSEWIKNRAGICPVPWGTHIEYKMKVHGTAVSKNPERLRWSITGNEWSDIIAYRYRLDDNTMTEEEAELPAQEWAGSITDSEEEAEALDDMVNHPPHYQSDNGIECIDAIRAALGKEGFIAYCRGNVIKYSWRIKANPAEDQGKAAWYANKAKEALEE